MHHNPGGAAPISPVARIARTGLATSALALGFAVPAHADTPPDPTSAGVPPAELTATAPTTPDVSAAAAGTAAQTGATNVNVSVRVGSPGDNGGVTQTIAAAVDAAAQIASAPSVESTVPPAAAAAAQAAVVQAAPVNVDLSVRLASPGNDGAVTQTISAAATAAAAQTQYQPPAAQYQPPATELPTAAPLPAPTSSTPPAATPAATSPTVPSLPSTWTWNWTWTCGDITQPGIAQTIDTGIQNWVWRWNLGGMCAASSPLPSQMPAVIPSLQSGGAELVLPTPPTPPTLPVLPDLPVVQPPAQTWPLSLAPALVQLTVPVGLDAFAPLFAPPAMSLQPLAPLSRLLLPRRSAPPPRFLDRYAAAWPADAGPGQRRQHATPAAPHRGQPNAARPAFLISSGFMQPSSGGGVASGGGGAGFGAGVTAALAIWILLALPGVAVLRLPASRRGPRAHVDDTRTRPG